VTCSLVSFPSVEHIPKPVRQDLSFHELASVRDSVFVCVWYVLERLVGSILSGSLQITKTSN
jgi:hypothetical protein